MRATIIYKEKIPTVQQLIEWGKQFDHFILLRSNNELQSQADAYGKYDVLAAVDALEIIENASDVFDCLKKNHEKNSDWLFGYLSYDVKNQLENLSSSNHDGLKTPLNSFFRPRLVLMISDKTFTIHYDEKIDNEFSVKSCYNEILAMVETASFSNPLEIKSRVSRKEYLDNFEKIKKHIQAGDVYELNYCIEFFNEDVEVSPPEIYDRLNNLSPMPFSAYLHLKNLYTMCASPERYLARRGNKIISQPIKGTARRGNNREEDENIKAALPKNPKEQSENVMIVDMVRNDLSRTAVPGSVIVKNLFEVKTFRQLHQLVSTIVSEMKKGIHFTEVISKSFPMGSMTGAPKVSAMQLIEKYEEARRGIYSGAIGYIDPQGDFDFNVVIRSINYNSANKYLSYMVGSAITAAAKGKDEYDECLLKAKAMMEVLSNGVKNVLAE